MTRVGFVGLGGQGGPMARRIVDAGYATTLWARRPASLEPFAATTAAVAATPAELGAASDVLGICVVDDAGVDEVLRGPDGAGRRQAPGGAEPWRVDAGLMAVAQGPEGRVRPVGGCSTRERGTRCGRSSCSIRGVW